MRRLFYFGDYESAQKKWLAVAPTRRPERLDALDGSRTESKEMRDTSTRCSDWLDAIGDHKPNLMKRHVTSMVCADWLDEFGGSRTGTNGVSPHREVLTRRAQ